MSYNDDFSTTSDSFPLGDFSPGNERYDAFMENPHNLTSHGSDMASFEQYRYINHDLAVLLFKVSFIVIAIIIILGFINLGV